MIWFHAYCPKLPSRDLVAWQRWVRMPGMWSQGHTSEEQGDPYGFVPRVPACCPFMDASGPLSFFGIEKCLFLKVPPCCLAEKHVYVHVFSSTHCSPMLSETFRVTYLLVLHFVQNISDCTPPSTLAWLPHTSPSHWTFALKLFICLYLFI